MSDMFFNELSQSKLKTYVGIVLDESGSMIKAYNQIISGLEEQIQSLQNGTTDSMDTIIVFSTFNEKNNLRKAVNVKDFDFEILHSYKPNGSTAMLDAVGDMINYLQILPDADDDNTSFLLIIASDGEENSSKRFSYSSIAEMIQSVKETKRWTVTYMGANQDLSLITDKLKIDTGNVTMFNASNVAGYVSAMSVTTNSINSYMVSRGAGMTSLDNFYAKKESS